MANLTFKDELKKDFQQLQESIIVQHEAYDHYCALKIAQKSVVSVNADQESFKNIMHSLEQLREYFLNIMLLDFLKVNLVSLNEKEAQIYTTALNDRVLNLQKEVATGKKDKKTLEDMKNEVQIIKIMLTEVGE